MMLCASCVYERLPSYPEYSAGRLAGAAHLRLDGFYYSEHLVPYPASADHGSDHHVKLFFLYADGSRYSFGTYDYDSIAGLEGRLSAFANTADGIHWMQEIGINWGLYRVRGDSLVVERYTVLNGNRILVVDRFLITSDTTMVRVPYIQGKKGWEQPSAARPPELFRFQRTTWKPDSTMFLKRNAKFIRVHER